MVVAMAHVLDIKPRVIAAEVKTQNHLKDHAKVLSKPHIAGELDLVGETTSEPHYVEVRDGTLLLYPGRVPRGPALWRLPLRRLNLQPASSGRPRGFSLSRHGESVPLATFQVGSDVEYERWVKTLAAELMRQTPLDAVRFLDILGITATLSPRSSPLPLRRTHSADSVNIDTPPPRPCWTTTTCSAIQEEEIPSSTLPRSTQSLHRQRKSSIRDPVPTYRKILVNSANCAHYSSDLRNNETDKIQPRLSDSTEWCNVNSVNKDSSKHREPQSISDCTDGSQNINPKSLANNWGNAPLPDVVRDLPPCERRSRTRSRLDAPRRTRGLSAETFHWSSEIAVAELMARCQQNDKYVPVRDKRLLFETLCRRHFVCSSENINLQSTEPGSLSMQPKAQSLHDLSQCHNVPVKEICRYFEKQTPIQNPVTKKRAFSDLRKMHRAERRLARARRSVALSEEIVWRLQEQSYQIRNGNPEILQSLEQQLAAERKRLKQQKDEMEKLQKDIESAIDQFGLISTNVRHHSNVR